MEITPVQNDIVHQPSPHCTSCPPLPPPSQLRRPLLGRPRAASCSVTSTKASGEAGQGQGRAGNRSWKEAPEPDRGSRVSGQRSCQPEAACGRLEAG